MMVHDVVIVLEGSVAFRMIVVVIIVQRLPYEVLRRSAMQADIFQALPTKQCKWCSPSTFAGYPPPYLLLIFT